MARAKPPLPSPPIDALLGFVLRHLVVTPFFGSRQHTTDDSYVCADRVLHDYNLIYVYEGAAVWTLAGEDHRLATGDLILVPPGVPHRGRSASRRMTLGSLHALAALPGGQDVFTLFAVPPVRRVPRGSRLDRVFRTAMEEYDPPATAAAMIPHWTALAVKELLRADAAAGRLRARAIDPVVAELVERMERRLAEPTSLAALARQAGYTPQHLVRRFRRSLGVSPMACLAALRLERAAGLLREGRMTVRAIAAAVGHDDAAYFSRAFRARFGRAPSEVLRGGSGSPT